MSDETIQIVVTDGVDTNISAKLKVIATTARDADASIKGLQSTIGTLNSNALATIASSANTATSALSSLSAAEQSLASIQDKATSAAQAQALMQAQLSSSLNMVQQSAASLNSAMSGLTTATNGVTAAARASSASVRAEADDVATLLGKIDPTVAALGRLDSLEMQLAAHRKANKIDTETYTDYKNKIDAARQSVDKMKDSTEKGTLSTVGARRELIVLGHELVSGNFSKMPGSFMVLAERMDITTKLFSPMAIGIAAVVAAMGVWIYNIVKAESELRTINGLMAEFQATGRSNVDFAFITQLRKELDLLPGVSKTAATEIIKAFADVRGVGAENLVTATKLTGDLGVALGKTAPQAAKEFAKALEDPLKGAIELDKQLGFLTVSNFKTIDSLMKAGKTTQAQTLLIDLLSKSISGLQERSMTPLQKATNDMERAWTSFMDNVGKSDNIKSTVDTITGLVIAITNLINKLNELREWKPPEWTTAFQNSTGGGLNGLVDKGLGAMGIKTNIAGMFGYKAPNADGGAQGSWAAAKPTASSLIKPNNAGSQYDMTTKQKTDAAGITGKKGSNNGEETRAAALDKINSQLSNQIKFMDMLGVAKEKEEAFDRINDGLKGRRIYLNDTEIAGIKGKIAAIVDGKKQQEESNRIYEEANGPLLAYNASQKAAAALLEKGAITQKDYDKEMIKSYESYSNIVNPLREYNIELDKSISLSKLNTDQFEIESQIQKIKDGLLKEGNVASKDELDLLRQRYTELQKNNQVTAQENSLLDASVKARKDYANQIKALTNLKSSPDKGFNSSDATNASDKMLKDLGIDTSTLKVGLAAQENAFKDMYTKLDQMRQANLISEQDASAARNQIWMKEQDAKLAPAQKFFTGLAALSTSSNRTLAAIGKAAAISNAVIDTYKSATGAYAAMSSIPYVGPALGAAAAAAAVAAGMANVAKIRSQGSGFMTGGYTGDIPTTSVAGVVHGQEYVMNAAATNRIGVDNLQALEKGAAQVGQNSAVGGSSGSGAGAAGGAAGGSAQPANVQVPVRVINVMDPNMISDYLATSDGQQVIVNTIRQNSDSLRATFANA